MAAELAIEPVLGGSGVGAAEIDPHYIDFFVGAGVKESNSQPPPSARVCPAHDRTTRPPPGETNTEALQVAPPGETNAKALRVVNHLPPTCTRATESGGRVDVPYLWCLFFLVFVLFDESGSRVVLLSPPRPPPHIQDSAHPNCVPYTEYGNSNLRRSDNMKFAGRIRIYSSMPIGQKYGKSSLFLSCPSPPRAMSLCPFFFSRARVCFVLLVFVFWMLL